MKIKHARNVIGRKVDDWLKSLPEDLRGRVKDDVIVTGGCIVSMLLGEKVNDYDVYFRTADSAQAVAEYYVTEFTKNPPTRFKNGCGDVKISVVREKDRIKIVVKSVGIAGESGSDNYAYFEQQECDEGMSQFVAEVVSDAVEATEDENPTKPGGKKYRPVFLSANAITLSSRVQVITRFFGEPADIHSTYDFAHCTCWWDSKDRSLHTPQTALECILARELRYLGQSKYPVCAMIRTRKFLNRGWQITAGQYLKIAWDICKLDLSDPAVLEDQLIGVDSAYFEQVLKMLREKSPGRIDGAYLMEVVDKVF